MDSRFILGCILAALSTIMHAIASAMEFFVDFFDLLAKETFDELQTVQQPEPQFI